MVHRVKWIVAAGSALPAGLLVAALLALALPATADAGSACNPAGGGAGAFCASASYSANPTRAAAPFGFNAQLTNTSPGFAADENRWFGSARLELDSAGTDAPTLTGSAAMPDGLIVAGGGSCTAPTYDDCTAGHGTLIVTLHPGGTTTGNFGIDRIDNVNPPASGQHASFTAFLHFCVNFGGSCIEAPETEEDFSVPTSSGGSSGPLTINFPLHGSAATSAGTADYSLVTLALHLDGQADAIDGGSPPDAPVTCWRCRATAARHGSARITSIGAHTVVLPQSLTVSGCPTAAVTGAVDGLHASLDASGSATPLAGRHLAAYHWLFGDGNTEITSSPEVTHDYATGGARTVSVVAEDNLGALSKAANVALLPLAPSSLSVEAKARGKHIKVHGTLTPVTGKRKVKLVLAKKTRHRFHTVAHAKVAADAMGAFAKKLDAPRGRTCRVTAAFAGSRTASAARARQSFRCRPEEEAQAGSPLSAGLNAARRRGAIRSSPMEIAIWHNPKCTTSRKVLARIEAAGIEPTIHRYLDDPPSPAEIAETLEILGIGPWDLLRKREKELIGELGLDELPRDDANREEWIRLMSANPRLIERPVVLTGDGRGVLARPPERVDELLG